ncbi:MAG: oligoendopeptidase F [Bacilli bacterium]|nr:oligoendopeptidase F [Bacilli bacterium]
MGKILERSKIDNKYKWDLLAIYKTVDEYLFDIDNTKKLINSLSLIKDVMTKSAKDLYLSINKILEAERKIDKIYTYAHLKYNENISDSKSIELLDKAENLNILFSQNTSFFSPLLLSMDYSNIEKMYKEYEPLKEYEIFLKKEFRYKKYMLSEKEEKLISLLSKSFLDNEPIFNSLTDSDIDFGTIKDENGKKVALTNTNYSLYVKSSDRRVRRDAFIKLYGTYKRYKTSITSLLEGEVKQNATFKKVRGYESSLDAAMYHDELNKDVYNSLITSVRDGLRPLYKYFKLKKDILGLDEMHVYDTYADIISDYNKTYSFDDAKKLIKETLSVFGEEYLSYIDKAFNEKWIDVMPNVGKTGGAFSGGCYDTYPYILTNFQGEFQDVSTLIHELGHSMHSYYSRNNNPYVYSGYSIVVAEVASTVNELLLARYVLDNSKDIKEKLYILDRLMNLFKATIYRQTMYEEFEKFLYDKVEQEETLTSDLLCDEFYKLNELYYGDDVVLDEEIRYEWERMPHLYYNFYMYKYATGLSSACQIVNQILNKEENAIDNYIKFLKTGSTLPPNEELKINGVDLTKRSVCDNAIEMFSNLVDEFEKTYNEYKKSSGGINE